MVLWLPGVLSGRDSSFWGFGEGLPDETQDAQYHTGHTLTRKVFVRRPVHLFAKSGNPNLGVLL